MRWFLRETTHWGENTSALAEVEEWTCLGEYPSLVAALRACVVDNPVCLTDSDNPYGGVFVSLSTLNRALGLHPDDTTSPAIDKYDALDDWGKACVLVHDLACEFVLNPVLVADVLQRTDVPEAISAGRRADDPQSSYAVPDVVA